MIQTDTNKAGLSTRDKLEGQCRPQHGPLVRSSSSGRKGKQLDQDPARQGWFAYFRAYSPTEAFFDKTWKLPDIER